MRKEREREKEKMREIAERSSTRNGIYLFDSRSTTIFMFPMTKRSQSIRIDSMYYRAVVVSDCIDSLLDLS